MPPLSHTLYVGRFEFTGQFEGVPLEYDGSLGMHSQDLQRLELQAAIAVFSQPEAIEGEELRFARKAMDLLQPALAALLEVTVGTVSRWETGAEPIGRQTQLSILLLLEHALQTGSPVVAVGTHSVRRRDRVSPIAEGIFTRYDKVFRKLADGVDPCATDPARSFEPGYRFELRGVTYVVVRASHWTSRRPGYLAGRRLHYLVRDEATGAESQKSERAIAKAKALEAQ